MSPVEATAELLGRHTPFDALEPGLLRWLAARLRLAYFPQGARILGPGPVERLYIVKQGAVRGTPGGELSGAPLVELTLGEGESFPIGALMARRPVAYDYTAARDSFVFELDEADFRALVEESPAFHRFCTETLAVLLEQSQSALRSQLADTLAEQGMLEPLRRLAHREPVSCAPQTPIREVLERMQRDRIGSMVVVDAAGRPLGIFTQPDALERVALAGRALEEPISAVMTRDPVTLPADAPAQEAAFAMTRHAIRHVVLVENGRFAGVVSERDLFALQRASPRRARERIRAAQSLEDLPAAAEEVRGLTHTLLAQGMAAEPLTRLITLLNDALVERALEIAAAARGIGAAWCWIALGSEGRMEQTQVTDQDNALVLGEAAGPKQPFLEFADEVNRLLERCGFPLCKGDIMARNPRWCLTLEEWRVAFGGWVRNPQPQALLGAAIFFDLRPVAGARSLGEELRAWLLERTAASPMFLRAMAENALQTAPPLGLLGDFVLEDGKLDLKKFGVRPLVDVARVWALSRRLPHSATAERLRAAAAAGLVPHDEALGAVEAFHYLQLLRLRAEANRIDPGTLNTLDRRILKESFRQGVKLQQRLRLDYQL